VTLKLIYSTIHLYFNHFRVQSTINWYSNCFRI